MADWLAAGRAGTANVVRTGDVPLVAALDRRWEDYRRRFEKCRGESSEAAVHDLRVASRRLLAVHELIGTLDAHPRIRRTRRRLRKLLDNLDSLRDIQVMRVNVSESPEHQGALNSFEAELRDREVHLLSRVRKRMRPSRPSTLRRWIAKTGKRLTKGSLRPDFPAKLVEAVDRIYLRTVRRLEAIDPLRPETIHRARIAFKRFRYAAETVEAFLPQVPESHFRRMHAYQGRMGEIRDLEILRAALSGFSRRLQRTDAPSAVSGELQRVEASYEARQRELIAAFMKDRDELHLFWRSTASQSFPWEASHDPVPDSARHRGSGERG